ncbi:hypothetical protein Tcan_03846 [Toxocara canis]|uniref:Ground-like domain-containing protein n=1 Tax=Toxocara canis TaxID=6265 RepID=A0A0B2VD84_TOXCA|nr:hypothetical protein Tcan_03846 [Toxocara canis]
MVNSIASTLILVLLLVGQSMGLFFNHGSCWCPPPPPPCVITTCPPAQLHAPPLPCRSINYHGSYAIPSSSYAEQTTSYVQPPSSYMIPQDSYVQTSAVGYTMPESTPYAFPPHSQSNPSTPISSSPYADQPSSIDSIGQMPSNLENFLGNVVKTDGDTLGDSINVESLSAGNDFRPAADEDDSTDIENVGNDIYDEILPQLPVRRPPLHTGSSSRLGTEGLVPYGIFDRRYVLLKRMKQRNQRASKTYAVSSTTCNNPKLAQLIAQAIDEDVGKSKRLVIEAIEMAFDGAKFDVMCAQGDFSYTVHSRQYCEATKGSITCFVFR